MFGAMPVDDSLVGRTYPPTAARTVSAEHVLAFATAIGDPEAAADGKVPPTYPITSSFDAMNDFLAAEQVELHRIVHGDQKFHYQRPVRVGDTLSASLTVTGLRQIGGNDILTTASDIHDADGALVCTTTATLVHRAAAGADAAEGDAR